LDSDYIRTTETNIGGASIKFKSVDGKETDKYNPRDIWGFIFKGQFFRSVDNELAMLVDTGKINYYINGFAGIGILTNPDHSAGHYMESESSCFLSPGDVTSKIYKMPLNTFEKKEDFRQLKKDFPQYKDVFDCMSHFGIPAKIYIIVRNCVADFNNSQKK